MVIVMKIGASAAEIREVTEQVEAMGYRAHLISGVERTVIGAVGDERGKAQLRQLEGVSGVEKVIPILRPFKLASREVRPDRSHVRVAGGPVFGGSTLTLIAGPCVVEREHQIIETALCVRRAGAHVLHAGVFASQTSPYGFAGMERDGLNLLAKAREESGLPVVTEVLDPEDVEIVASRVDMLQVGAHNVQNFALLKRLGQVRKPVLLKRGLMTTLQEFLMAAEYILSEGNPDVVLCEPGIRTFETATRNTLDLSAIPVLHEWSHLPVIVDPSHGTGHWRYVEPMACAAVAAGADGLMIEVHPYPDEALSGGGQSLRPARFAALVERLRAFAAAAGRSL